MSGRLSRFMSDYESVRRWLERVEAEGSGSYSTKINYVLWLEKFCSHVNMNPDKIIEVRKKDLEASDLAEKHRFEDKLLSFFNKLQREGYKRGSAVYAFCTVCSFFRANYVPLRVNFPASWVETTFKVPSREELKAMVENAPSLQAKAWILCQAQSGISGGDLLNLPLDQVKPQLDQGKHPIYIKLLRKKTKGKGPTGGWYETFFGRNAADALREWLPNKRKNNGRIWDWTTLRHVERVVSESARKAGLDGRVTPHSLRKFFNTYAKIAGVNETVVEYFMGHSVGRIRATYFIPPKHELEKLYLKAEPYLSI